VGTEQTGTAAKVTHDKPQSGGTFNGKMPENICLVDELTLGDRR
jgi:hypothetical protein